MLGEFKGDRDNKWGKRMEIIKNSNNFSLDQ